MDDFVCLVAAQQKCPSLAFGFKSLHTPVFVDDFAVPKRLICAVVPAIDPIGLGSHLSLRLPADCLPRSVTISYSIF
jgi:hypothetical protein